HPTDRWRGGRVARLAQGARCHAERTALRGPRRRSAEPRRPRRPHSEVRGRSRRAVPNLADEADLSSHAAAYSHHANSACRRRHLGHRVVARHEQVDPTQIYLHADLGIKERALARTKPSSTNPGRFRPSDSLLAFLKAL